MRAAVIDSYGPAEALAVREVPEPTLERPGDVRIAVHCASVNPIDVKIRAGLQRGALRYRLPWIGGLDVSGTVLEVGPGVSRVAVGDAVMGCPDWRRPGSFAEQVVCDQDLLVRKPDELPFDVAAALPLVGLTAWQCLLPRLAERPGQRVLIEAGAGGVGHVAIQLAKHHGAWVAATASERNRAYLDGLGVDRVVDYRAEDWWEVLEPVDVILDALGYEATERALQHVARGGRVASIVSGLPRNTERWGPTLGVLRTGLHLAAFAVRGWLRGVDASTVVKRTDPAQLQQLVDLAVAGAVRIHVQERFALDDIAGAHRQLETGRTRGKVVVQVAA